MPTVAKRADVESAAKALGIPLTKADVTKLIAGRPVSLDKLTVYEYARLLLKVKAAKTTVIRDFGKKKGTQKKMDEKPRVLPVAPGDFDGIHIPSSSGGCGGYPVKCWDTDGQRCCLYIGLFSIGIACGPST